MKRSDIIIVMLMLLMLVSSAAPSFSQSKGLKTITAEDLRYHLEFLADPVFRGRETTSQELEIATLYMANLAKHRGLKPILADGSFYQTIPLTVNTVSVDHTRLHLLRNQSEVTFFYGKSFGGNFRSAGSFSGDLFFAGFGYTNTEAGWDDLKEVDITGKVVMILDARVPSLPLSGAGSQSLSSRINRIRSMGASAVLVVVSREREAAGSSIFKSIPSGRMATLYDSQRTRFDAPQQAAQTQTPQARPSLPFAQAEIRHDVAARILGISKEEIGKMFVTLEAGKAVEPSAVRDTRVQLDVVLDSYEATSSSVIAMVEGSDPVLKNEYVVVCGHHDHLGMTGGVVIAGADDNGTGTVALIEIAEALMTERPRRSVIIAWFTGEERGLIGAHYFINNCPVPVEKISACINLDMLGRNSRDSLFLVASDLLSTELDASINKVNRQFGVNFNFDYTYSNLTHPQRVYFRSDHYPMIRFGIPSVWLFCGFTPDYHTPRDVLEFIDYTKFLKATPLAYLSVFDIGNRKELLKLDVNPAVTSRGSHNLREVSLFQATGR
jgi:Zn-dependent M28 family amino/carboxypeptidase